MISIGRARQSVSRIIWLVMLVYYGGTAVAIGNSGYAPNAVEVHVLDLSQVTLQQFLGPEILAPEKKKFVQIEVSRVTNPERVALSFNVHFRPAGGKELFLGSFSLYPPDNPGTFIVATRGMLKTGGTVSVTLAPVQNVSGNEKIKIWIKPLTFLAEQ